MPNNSKDLINLLTEKRKKLKLTQNKLSKKVNKSHTSIARIENGEMNPTLSVFIELANQLGYDVVLKELDLNEGKEPVIISEEEKFKKSLNNAGYQIINDNPDDSVLVLKKKKKIKSIRKLKIL